MPPFKPFVPKLFSYPLSLPLLKLLNVMTAYYG